MKNEVMSGFLVRPKVGLGSVSTEKLYLVTSAIDGYMLLKPTTVEESPVIEEIFKYTPEQFAIIGAVKWDGD
jgi:hypothetical protein